MSTPSKACCNIPPVEVDYTAKGSYIDIQGMKTYKTGSPSATTAILVIGDIFGNGPQVLQGADILADGGEKKYQVFVPDLLQGQYADHSWFPPDTTEKQEAMGAYFGGPANPGTAAQAIAGTVNEIVEKSNGTITKWASLGLCWGGKVAALVSGSGTPFSAVVSVHPAMVDAQDAESISIPFAMLASKDEDPAAVKKFVATLKGEKYEETFSDMPHGWMAARGDLSIPRVKAEYKRGYETTLDFFYKHL